MPAVHTLLVFCLVAVVFVVIPGPSVLFVVAQGLRNGSKAAVAGAAGTATGAMTYVAVTAAGLSALIASSSTAFAALHYAGAAYLCWLGVMALLWGRGEQEDTHPTEARRRSPWRSYRQGVVVELGNPKVALFFLALFPQFLHDDAGPAVTQVLVLGALFVVIGFLSDAFWGSLAGRLRTLRSFRPSRRFDRATGLVYLGLGGWAAATGSRS